MKKILVVLAVAVVVFAAIGTASAGPVDWSIRNLGGFTADQMERYARDAQTVVNEVAAKAAAEKARLANELADKQAQLQLAKIDAAVEAARLETMVQLALIALITMLFLVGGSILAWAIYRSRRNAAEIGTPAKVAAKAAAKAAHIKGV